MPSETTTACVSLLVFFRIRRGTSPYSVEDDASTISQTPTTHYTNTCVKLKIVTHLSFSARIAIANLSSPGQIRVQQYRSMHTEAELYRLNLRRPAVPNYSHFHCCRRPPRSSWYNMTPVSRYNMLRAFVVLEFCLDASVRPNLDRNIARATYPSTAVQKYAYGG